MKTDENSRQTFNKKLVMLTKSHEDILGGLTYKGFKKEGEIHNESDKKETLISRSCDERRMITNLLGPIMVDNKKSCLLYTSRCV